MKRFMKVLAMIILAVVGALQVNKEAHDIDVLHFFGYTDLSSWRYPVYKHAGNGQVFGITSMAGIDYQIPVHYIGFGLSAAHSTEILVNAVYPEMTPLYLGNNRSVPNDRWLLISVTDAGSTTSFEFRRNLALRRMGALSDRVEELGLQKFVASNERMGKTSVWDDPTISKNDLYADVYTELRAGDDGLYILCDGNKDVPFPQCELHFTSEGLLYDVTFNKDKISQWKDVQTKVEGLIHSFQIQKNATSAGSEMLGVHDVLPGEIRADHLIIA